MSSGASTHLEMSNLIGNDVVDLTSPEISGKAFDIRYINHICVENERSFLISVEDRHSTLWAIWAAKEAAFKIIKKIFPKIGFSPRKFIVECQPLNNFITNHIINSRVNYGCHSISIRWLITSDYVHCTALWPEQKSAWSNLRSEICSTANNELLLTTQNFSNHEMLSVKSKESYLVRLLAKRLLSENGVKNAKIVRDLVDNKLGPPYVLQNYRRSGNYDLSLSHHGKFAAALVLIKNC